MTDRAALRAIRNGDAEAIAPVIDRYTAYLGTIIRGIIGMHMTREDIEETVSDVFLVLWNNSEKPRDGKLKEWLGAVARNKAKNKLRELTGTLPLEEDIIKESADSPEDDVIRNEEARLIRRAVDSMKKTDREIFLRHYYGIETVSSIAQSMGMSESAVKARLMRGREKLRAKLEKGGYLS